MVEKLGMSDRIGFHAEPTRDLMGDELKNKIDNEVRSIIKESEKRATKILGNHKKHLKKLSEELHKKEVLSPVEVKEIITDVNSKESHNCDMCKALLRVPMISEDKPVVSVISEDKPTLNVHVARGRDLRGHAHVVRGPHVQ